MTSNLGSDGPDRRYTVFNELLKAADLAPKLKQAVTQPEPGKPKLLGIKLYVYGFSRGAASARAFVNWLSELLPGGRRKGSKPELRHCGIRWHCKYCAIRRRAYGLG